MGIEKPTEKQLKCIAFIEHYTFNEFEGYTKQDAIDFISKYLEQANKNKGKAIRDKANYRLEHMYDKKKREYEYVDGDYRQEDYGYFY